MENRKEDGGRSPIEDNRITGQIALLRAERGRGISSVRPVLTLGI